MNTDRLEGKHLKVQILHIDRMPFVPPCEVKLIRIMSQSHRGAEFNNGSSNHSMHNCFWSSRSFILCSDPVGPSIHDEDFGMNVRGCYLGSDWRAFMSPSENWLNLMIQAVQEYNVFYGEKRPLDLSEFVEIIDNRQAKEEI